MEGLGSHDIVGIGTVKYKVLDDNSQIKNIVLHNAIHVPTLKIRLISIQQLTQQNQGPQAGGHILSNKMILRWNGNTKTVPYNTSNNLPNLYTAPGGKRATAYICKHIRTFAYKMTGPSLSNGMQI